MERLLAAVGQVQDHTAQPVQADARVVKHEGGVVRELGARLQAVCSCRAGVQRHAAQQPRQQRPRVRVAHKVHLA